MSSNPDWARRSSGVSDTINNKVSQLWVQRAALRSRFDIAGLSLR